MNKAQFFDTIKATGIFGSSLSDGEVSGCEAIIDECMAQRATLEQAAYILATAHGETGGRMQPIRENMNYSLKRMKQVFSASRLGPHPERLVGNPQAIANQVYNGMLGNRPGTNDGWIYRGGGIGQTTGRDSYQKGARLFGMSVEDFVAHNNTTKGAAQYLVRGMLNGWTTGRKLGDFVGPGRKDYFNARRTWNGTFEAARYAKLAEAFENALRAGGYAPGRATTTKALGGAVAASGAAAAAFPDYAAQIIGAALFLAVVVLMVKLIKRNRQ